MAPVLSALATTIIAQLPALIDSTIEQDKENSTLQEECNQLKLRIEVVKRSIECERAKQQRLRKQLLKLNGPQPSKSGSIRQLRAALGPRKGDAENTGRSCEKSDLSLELGSFWSDEPPMSVRSKRKGMIFADDVRIVKRMRMD